MLKPSELGLDGKYRTITDHKKLLTQKVMMLKNKKIVRVLLTIMDSQSNSVIDVSDLKQTEINEIKNYFSECVAPILLFTKTNLMNRAKCFYPSSQTESLYDFKVCLDKDEYLFSNKQLKGGTNTLKPGDVVELVKKDSILSSKWIDTKTYKTFKILNDNNVISGPITAIKELYPLKAAPISKIDMNKVISQMTKNDVIIQNTPKSIMDIIKKDEVAYEHYNKKRVVSGTMINFIFEKILIDISKQDKSYNELFLDVTNNNVHFFKFDLSTQGKLIYGVSDPKKSSSKAILRSKQGVERRSSGGQLKLDKLGFQP